MATPPPQTYQRVPTKTTSGPSETIIGINNKGEVTLSPNIRNVDSKDLGVNGQNVPIPFAYWDSRQKKFLPYDASTTIPDGSINGQPVTNWLTQNEDSLTKNSAALINKTYRDTIEERNKFNVPGVWKETVATTVGTATSTTVDNTLFLSDEEKNKLENFEFKTKGVRTEWENLRYPEKLESESSDVIQFTMLTYGTKNFNKDIIGLSDKRSNNLISNSTVTLSIQPRISDTNQVNWQESNADLISLGMAQGSLNFIESGFDGTKGTLDAISNSLGAEKENVKLALKVYFAGQAANTQNLFGRLTGGILNPNLELLFDGPTTRTFNYNFIFSPRSDTEAKIVSKIIRFFKEGMAAQRTEANLFLKAPNVFNIKYLLKEGSSDHPFINRVKGPCALTNCSVDYTPNGSYMTYSDGSMISYNVSLTFQELEPLYADDYKDIPIDQIGF